MSLINWNKPTKVTRGGQFDGGPPGGYVPQMSDEDASKWRGKHINKGKAGERIELRKTFNGCGSYAQVLVVLDSNHIKMSTNGSMEMMFDQFDEMFDVINEARRMLE